MLQVAVRMPAGTRFIRRSASLVSHARSNCWQSICCFAQSLHLLFSALHCVVQDLIALYVSEYCHVSDEMASKYNVAMYNVIFMYRISVVATWLSDKPDHMFFLAGLFVSLVSDDCRFRCTDQLGSLFDAIDVHTQGQDLPPGSYRVVAQFPRRVFTEGTPGSLRDVGLAQAKQETVLIEPID